MRDIHLDSNDFCRQVEITIQKWLLTRSKDLRSKVVDNSNFQPGKYFFKVHDANLKNIIRLAIVSWYLPEEPQFVLRMDLEEKINTLSLEDKFLCEQFLSSKAEMLIFLIETKLWHTRDFFGNLLKDLDESEKHLQVYHRSNKVEKPQRKRGYHDHGSRVLDHKWLPKEDWSLTQEQNLIEFRRSQASDTLQFIKGFLT